MLDLCVQLTTVHSIVKVDFTTSDYLTLNVRAELFISYRLLYFKQVPSALETSNIAQACFQLEKISQYAGMNFTHDMSQ